MSNWPTTLADLATGAGTLVLPKVATFASVRSANQVDRDGARRPCRPGCGRVIDELALPGTLGRR